MFSDTRPRLFSLWNAWMLVVLMNTWMEGGDCTELRYQMKEELANGTIIGNVAAEAFPPSKEYPSNLVSKFRFKFLTPPPIKISINETTGEIAVNGRIDREAICGEGGESICRVRLDVAVHPIQYFQILKITFEIQDVNDNSPEFHPAVIVHDMIESASPGTSFVIPTAKDADLRWYSVDRYELIDPDRVVLLKVSKKLDGSTEVRLVLAAKLDREKKKEHQITVVAYDAGVPSRSGSVNVTIVVVDANDNSPTFEYTSYEALVDENIPVGTTIAKVGARDLDDGLNAQILYSLSTSSQNSFGDVFSVNNVTGEIYVIGVVDYEQTPVYHLIVTAQDRGQDPVPSETTVIVRVNDQNDNAPKITVNTLIASDTSVADVVENNPPDTFVGHVIVHDPDRGDNGRFTCNVTETRFRLLQMFANEYHVVTSVEFDYEKENRYSIAIVCTDGGETPLVSGKQLTVNVIDVNDNPPVFSQNVYVAELFENNYNGAFVVQVNATDDDSEANAFGSYWIQKDGTSRFSIDPQTGIVTATAALDHEIAPEYRFTVFAKDKGVPPQTSSTQVVIRVLDVNDERPKFVQEAYSFQVGENRPIDTVVGQVSADDADDPPFNQFDFSLVSGGSLSDAFRIDPVSGRIVTTRFLDREEQKVYHVIAVVSDRNSPQLTSTASVTIRVLDANDQSPTFIFPSTDNHTIQVNAALLDGQTVARIHAHDNDEGPNAEIIYSIVKGNEQNVFSLDPTSGELRTNVALATLHNSTFSLVLTATDRGDTATAKVYAYLNIIVVRVTDRDRGGVRFFGNLVIASENYVAIFIVGGISAVVIIALLIAIAVVVCQQRRRAMGHSSASQKYNCRDAEAQKARDVQMMNGGPTPPVSEASTAEVIPVLRKALDVNNFTDGQGFVPEEPGKENLEVRLDNNGQPISRTVHHGGDTLINRRQNGPNGRRKPDLEIYSDYFSSSESLVANSTLVRQPRLYESVGPTPDGVLLTKRPSVSSDHQNRTIDLRSQALLSHLKGELDSNSINSVAEVSSADSGRPLSSCNEDADNIPFNPTDDSNLLPGQQRSTMNGHQINRSNGSNIPASFHQHPPPAAADQNITKRAAVGGAAGAHGCYPTYRGMSSFKDTNAVDKGQTSVLNELHNNQTVAYEIRKSTDQLAMTTDRRCHDDRFYDNNGSVKNGVAGNGYTATIDARNGRKGSLQSIPGSMDRRGLLERNGKPGPIVNNNSFARPVELESLLKGSVVCNNYSRDPTLLKK